jgi:hypothetical protein
MAVITQEEINILYKKCNAKNDLDIRHMRTTINTGTLMNQLQTNVINNKSLLTISSFKSSNK